MTILPMTEATKELLMYMSAGEESAMVREYKNIISDVTEMLKQEKSKIASEAVVAIENNQIREIITYDSKEGKKFFLRYSIWGKPSPKRVDDWLIRYIERKFKYEFCIA